MKTYPTTTKPLWGKSESWQGIENWHTRMQFSTEHRTVQEVVPAFTELRAELKLIGEPGDYLLEFPGGKQRVSLENDHVTLDVSTLVTTGKHLYQIISNLAFDATLTIIAVRPLVKTENEGFCVDWHTLTDGERQHMAGDRPAHRVGKWSRWIKLLPHDSRITQISGAELHLDQARFHPPLPEYHADFSGKHYDDSLWTSVSLPHKWESTESEGYAWYRFVFTAPEAWQNEQVVVHHDDPDAEIMVYVNGHTAGYYQPNGRPLQFSINTFLHWGTSNVLTLRISQNTGNTYQLQALRVGVVEQFGLSFAGRLYPASEDALQVSLYSDQGTRLQAAGLGRQSHFSYRPPEIIATNLRLGLASLSVKALSDDAEHCLWFDLHTSAETSYWVHVRVDVDALSWSGLKITQTNPDVLTLTDPQKLDGSLQIRLPGLQRWFATENWDKAQIQDQFTTDLLTKNCDLLLRVTGATTLTIARETPSERNYEDALARWNDVVYHIARPLHMSDVEAAAWRAYKQTVLLNARNVPDDVAHGLLAAFDKPVFHVYWMRDCAISTPGAIYTGGEAQQTAFENVGPTLDLYAKIPECIGIYPDGTPREGGFSDGPALGIAAQGYAYALLGQDWLRKHYSSVEQQLNYLLERDATDGDALDGLIRSSQGDWKDAGSMRRIWRVGAVFFVNVAYLRALRIASGMAEALGNREDAQRWHDLRERGVALINQDVEHGGLWLSEQGYFADWVQVDGEKSWVYPRDVDDVTVFTAFSTTAHGMALAEGIIPEERISSVVQAIERYQLLDPFPAPAKYPFYDVLAETGQIVDLPESLPLSNPWKLKEFIPDLPDWLTYDMVLPWKGLPGNHVWGGRWMMSGAWLTLGLWRAGYTELARKAQNNLAHALSRARHPGRCEETESYSAISREETGSHVDPAGYYQLWSGAVPLQALVEGQYGIKPEPYGFDLDLRHYRVGDGIRNVPVRGGFVSCERQSETVFSLELNTTEGGQLRLIHDFKHITISGDAPAIQDSSSMSRILYQPKSRIQFTVQEG